MQILKTHTLNEIQTQPKAWQEILSVIGQQIEALRDLWVTGDFAQVIFTGCGSTYYLSLAAAALLQELIGMNSRGLPASEIWLYPGSAFVADRRTLLVAVSRSGATTETVRACETFRTSTGGQGQMVTLSCYPDSPLASLGNLNLILSSGQEDSIAQTRAFSTLYLATTALAALWANNFELFAELSHLPNVAARLLTDYRNMTQELGSDTSLDRFYFLGSGARYGLACELSLKMKEMSLSHSEPFHFLEFRHGPKSMVTPQTLIIGLVSEANRAHELAVLADLQVQGGRTLALGESGMDVTFASGVSEAARNALYLPIGQLLAFERAVHKGLNPDRPNHLEAVVKLQ